MMYSALYAGIFRGMLCLMLGVILNGCNTRKGIMHNPKGDPDQARKLVVFLDIQLDSLS